MKTIHRICIALFTFGVAVLFIATGYYLAATKNVALSDEKLRLNSDVVTVYDANGAPLPCVRASSIHETVRFDDLPTHTKQAFVCTEDKRFYSHNGFDYKRIAKAIFNNVKAGAFKEGASTISQQLIKNTHLSQEKTLKRKLKEWKLTRVLEKKYSKDEILEKYLNVIYFGHNCFGIRDAAAFYFNKSPNELDLADSAILAGLVKSPNNFSPFKNPKNCLKRKETVLTLMYKNGKISADERRNAMQTPLPDAPTVRLNDMGYLHFVFEELSSIAADKRLNVGGQIEIYTYLDSQLQNRLQQLFKAYGETDFSAQVLDVHTGGFKACISTVGDLQRLPASLLKPLLVYAPSIERELISPATPLLDEKINYGGYSPENFDKKYRGYVSAREALAKSLNVPAVRLLETLGVQTGAQFLDKLGLPVEREDFSLALALGGMKNGYSLRQLLSAYSALVNDGNYTCGAFIAKIKMNGRTVYERKTQASQVFSRETAYLTSDMLQTAVKNGTAKKLRSLPFAVAAKTGTVGTANGNTDCYTLSYTTRDCIGVWLGNKDNSFIPYTGGGKPCDFVLQIHDFLHGQYQANGEKINNFTVPDGVECVCLDKTAYDCQHSLILADERAPVEYRFQEWFKRTAVPKKQCDLFSNPTICTPILQFENGQVVITFDESCPKFYQYRIERREENTSTLVYQGAFIKTFTDENITKDKLYQYTVTAVYQDIRGKPLRLPTVNTKSNPPPTQREDGILQKNWWEY